MDRQGRLHREDRRLATKFLGSAHFTGWPQDVRHVWTADFTKIATPVKFGPGRFPMWSPDGKRLLFTGSDGMRLFWQSSDGSGSPELLSDTARAPESCSTATELVSYTLKEGSAGRDYDIWVFSPSDRTTRALIVVPTTSEQSSRFSPDGKWLAYQSNENGRFEIYVEPFPRTGVRTRVSNAGGERPVWSPDGKEIVYDHDQTLYSVSFSPAPTSRVETPR
jgi:Tol biopolymer transport system component